MTRQRLGAAEGIRPHPLKRVFDLAVVTILAPLWVPAIGVLAVVVRIKLGSPVLFVQRRPGRDERPFDMRKFRTMTDARDAQGNLLHDRDRLTPFGRWLRATSLDELPEIYNVLRGEMSLVGPRPLLMEYLPRYSVTHRLRHAVPPGMTGLAQVSGRNALTWPARFDLDVEYARANSLWLDIRILWKTVAIVFRREGIAGGGEVTMSGFYGYEDDAR